MAHQYDVFLSHSSADKPAVEAIAERLRDEARLRPFLDKWHLVPGEAWIPALERALERSAVESADVQLTIRSRANEVIVRQPLADPKIQAGDREVADDDLLIEIPDRRDLQILSEHAASVGGEACVPKLRARDLGDDLQRGQHRCSGLCLEHELPATGLEHERQRRRRGGEGYAWHHPGLGRHGGALTNYHELEELVLGTSDGRTDR